MPLYIKEKKRILFLHIPKCAGSSVEKVLRSKTEKEMFFSKKRNFFPCTPQHFHKEVLETLIDFEELERFAVVRHPLLKMISEYKWKIKKGWVDSRKISFDKFVQRSISRAKKNPFYSDNHFRPMTQFVDDNTKVFRLEFDSLDLEVYLSSFLGDEVRLEKVNKTSNFNFSVSKKTLLLINEYYSEDFRVFGYEKIMDPSSSLADIERDVVTKKEYIGLSFVGSTVLREKDNPIDFNERTIWFYWDKGIDEAPEIVKMSLNNWTKSNPEYDVINIHDGNLNSYFDFDVINFINQSTINLGVAGKSDFIRVLFLYHYGGIWVDSTTFCLKPLCEWESIMKDKDFFIFTQPLSCKDRQLVSWFIYSKKGNSLTKRLLEESVKYLFKERFHKLKPKGNASKWEKIKFHFKLNAFLISKKRKKESVFSQKNTGFEYLFFLESVGLYPYFWFFYIFNEIVKEGFDYSSSVSFSQPSDSFDKFIDSLVSKQTYKRDVGFFEKRVKYLEDKGLL